MIELNKTPEELYMIALQFHYVLDDYDLATSVYNLLIEKYPDTTYSNGAQMQMHPDYQPSLKQQSILRILRHTLKLTNHSYIN